MFAAEVLERGYRIGGTVCDKITRLYKTLFELKLGLFGNPVALFVFDPLARIQEF